MPDPNLKLAYDSMRFGLRRCHIYHEKRVLFWRTLLFVAQGSEAALNSTAAAFLFAGSYRAATQWFVVTSAVVSFIVLWFCADRRVQVNMDKKAKFNELEITIPPNPIDYTTERLEEIRKARVAIEKDDDVIMECVDAIAHNATVEALKEIATCLNKKTLRITLLQRVVGSVLPIPYIEMPEKTGPLWALRICALIAIIGIVHIVYWHWWR